MFYCFTGKQFISSQIMIAIIKFNLPTINTNNWSRQTWLKLKYYKSVYQNIYTVKCKLIKDFNLIKVI